MDERLRWRALAVGLLACLLAGLLLLAGTIEPNPAENRYADADDIEDDPDRYVDERVTIGGTVVETDPLTVDDEGRRFVVENVDKGVSSGDHLSVYGTLRGDRRVDAIETIEREPRERQYMFLVSFLAGVWVLGRLLNRWTLDTTAWALTPRTEPLLSLRE